MADIYLDNDVPLELAELLRHNGHNAIATRDERLTRAPDDEQLLTAAERRQILVTHNLRDFALLHNAWRRWPLAWRISPVPDHAGIIVLEQGRARDLLHVLHGFIRSGPSLLNELYHWRWNSGWGKWDLVSRRWVPHPE